MTNINSFRSSRVPLDDCAQKYNVFSLDRILRFCDGLSNWHAEGLIQHNVAIYPVL